MAAPRPAAPDRRERRWGEVHARLLEAAAELFDERGVQATKVAEIADRADVAHKTFFNHFPTKDELVRELCEAALTQLLADIDAARRSPGPTADRLARFFEQIASNALEAGPMHRELLAELIHAGHGTGTEPDKARRLHDAFGALVRDGVAAGEVTRAHAPAVLTDMILGAFYALMFNWAQLDDYPIRRRARATARFLGDALAARGKEQRT
jgi:AcrR family transcriptional regulator